MYSSLLAYTSPLVGTHFRLTLLLWSTNIKELEVNSFLQISIVEVPEFESGLLESKSKVLTITPYLNIQADREGFEPSEEFTSVVLETTALNHSATDLYLLYQYYQSLVPLIGFEPMTHRIWICCSTTELQRYLERSKGIEPSLFLLGREMPYH